MYHDVYGSSYMMCEDTFAINPPVLLEHYETKIRIRNAISAFMETSSWNASVRQNSNFLIFKSVLLEVLKATGELWQKIWQQIQLNLENVGITK